ncbi:MAG: transposase family protein [Prevotellaceae bacterium]|nr:transposase family protein [Prevotellaceae bacterium]
MAGHRLYRTQSRKCTVKMPTGKPKRKDLSEERKRENRKISSFRIAFEHATGGVKRCRILRERFRCHKYGFDDTVMPVACGLHNFRISFKESLINSYCT